MQSSDKQLTFKSKEFKGSRLRCLQFTSLNNESVAAFLTDLVQPHAKVYPKDTWKPCGMLAPSEVDLRKSGDFLTADQRQKVTTWWFDAPQPKSRTPNWDIVVGCKVRGKAGLVLVEAKAHPAELCEKDRCKAGPDNGPGIKRAIEEASKALGGPEAGWALDTRSHYQLSNRFAWAWKVASMGTPVVLVYLGFLNATEMITDSRQIFRSADEWEERLRNYSNNVVPPDMWNDTVSVNGTPLTALIRAADITVEARVVARTG